MYVLNFTVYISCVLLCPAFCLVNGDDDKLRALLQYFATWIIRLALTLTMYLMLSLTLTLSLTLP